LLLSGKYSILQPTSNFYIGYRNNILWNTKTCNKCSSC